MGALMLACLFAIPDFPDPAPKWLDMESESRMAIRFLEKTDESDRPFIRFVSTYSIDKPELPEFENLFLKFQWRQLTRNSNRRNLPVRVPGSETLWWFDLRSFNWNDAAWRAVALRDKAFRQPNVDNRTAQTLRKFIGENQPENFHVIAIVDAFGLFRRTYQTTETSDYYDLLFAEERFPLVKGEVEQREFFKWWKGGIDEYGKDCPPGYYEWTVNFPKRKFVDFPKNYDEWLGAFLQGVKLEDYENAITKLKSRRGAVIRGMEDTTGTNKSFVAKNVRLAWMESFVGIFGSVYGQTFDVKKTSGVRDLEENAFTDQPVDKKRQFRDGGELLITLPAGDGQASLVINGKGERVEVVPADIAIHTRDPRDRTVRNGPMVCFNCHAEAYGWIPLPNIIEKDSPDETDIRFQKFKDGRWIKDKQTTEDFDAFFIGWQDTLKPSREIMKTNWLQLTGKKANGYKDGLTGAQIGALSLKWKHKYDNPLDIKQKAREIGAPEPFVRLAAVNLTTRRAINAVRKDETPRPAWDEDLFPEVMKAMVASKELLTPKVREK